MTISINLEYHLGWKEKGHFRGDLLCTLSLAFSGDCSSSVHATDIVHCKKRKVSITKQECFLTLSWANFVGTGRLHFLTYRKLNLQDYSEVFFWNNYNNSRKLSVREWVSLVTKRKMEDVLVKTTSVSQWRHRQGWLIPSATRQQEVNTKLDLVCVSDVTC